MENNYYVHVTDIRKYEGPFSFREAMARKMQYDSFGVFTQILKVVVDENGKEVK